MSIASEITRINTNIANSYTAVDNKNGTLPQVQNSANLASAIDSIEVIESATAEGESLSLTNTKAMPYSDYVVKGKSEQDGEPSPSIPSEIHSVADDVNLFNEPKVLRTAAGLTFTYNNKKIKLTGTAGAKYFGTNNILQNIKAGTYTFSSTNTNSNLTYNMWLYNSSNQLIGNTKVNNPVTISEDATYYVLFVEGLTNGTTYNEEVNVKLQKGTVVTPYSEHGKGTVTIKQRGTTENNDYIIQTEPLRGLPNGVKDTIEAEQHRRILQVDMGNLTWVYSAGRFYANDVKETIKGNSSGLIVSNIMCDTYNAITPANWYAKSEIGIAIGGNGYGDAGSILVYDSNYTSKSSFETAMQGHYLICELATEAIEPLTQNQANTLLDITHTGSYEGTTNIYTDEDVKPTIGVDYYKKK